jgi:hypothetical protein
METGVSGSQSAGPSQGGVNHAAGDENSQGNVVETTSFIEEPQEYVVAQDTTNSIANVDDTPDLALGDFLSRPLTISSFSWATTDPVGVLQSLDPWHLFINNDVVKRKLNNYAFLRAKLHVKVIINATPFQYGLLRCVYNPLYKLTPDRIRITSNAENMALTPFSQLPGFYIEPQTNMGGQMECPFIRHTNWLDITSNTDVTNMGTIRFVVFSPLDVALPTVPTSISVRVVAWMTDVKVMATTRKLVLQADEYEKPDGAVSRPATAVANFASYLTHVPVIGRFARATQIGASAVAKVAAIFGFTNVPNISDVAPIYQMSAPQLATAEISVPYQKLALDPKTELSIDPHPHTGGSEDELAISYIKKRESYFGSTSWSTSDSVGTQVFNVRVNPVVLNVLSLASGEATVGYRYYNTWLSHLANMFENWRGSIKIRMKVVRTKYHRGRLKVQWDPLFNITTQEPTLNEVYTKIIDIGDEDDVTFTIPYHQARAWLNVHKNSTTLNYSTGGNLAPNSEVHNGVMTVRVYNTLEAPNAGSVQLLFYISAGDDFEFNNPTGQIGPGTLAANVPVPSMFALQAEEVMGELSKPSPDRYGQNFGEATLSLRKLARRAVILDTVQLPPGAPNATNVYRKGVIRMPYCPGYNSNYNTSAARVIGSGNTGYAFNTMHPLLWISSMYLGYRGGVNCTMTVNSPKVKSDDIRVVRVTDTGGVTASNRFIELATSIPGSASFSEKMHELNINWFQRPGTAGYALTSASASPSLQFTLPHISSRNFSLYNPSWFITGNVNDGTEVEGVTASIIVANTGDEDEVGYTTLQTALAAGSDWTCLYLLCTPTIDGLVGYGTPAA